MGVEGTTKVIGVAGTTLLVVVIGGNDLTILLPALTTLTVIPIKAVENYVGCSIENKNPFANISPLKCVSPTHALPNNLNCGVLVLKKLK